MRSADGVFHTQEVLEAERDLVGAADEGEVPGNLRGLESAGRHVVRAQPIEPGAALEAGHQLPIAAAHLLLAELDEGCQRALDVLALVLGEHQRPSGAGIDGAVVGADQAQSAELGRRRGGGAGTIGRAGADTKRGPTTRCANSPA